METESAMQGNRGESGFHEPTTTLCKTLMVLGTPRSSGVAQRRRCSFCNALLV